VLRLIGGRYDAFVGAAAIVCVGLLSAVGAGGARALPGDPGVPPVFYFQPTLKNLLPGQSTTVQYQVAGSPSVSCQWQFGGTAAAPGTWTDISGATSCASYTFPTADVNKWARVVVTATNAEGTEQKASYAYRVGGEIVYPSGSLLEGTTMLSTGGSTRDIMAQAAGINLSGPFGAVDVSDDGMQVAYVTNRDPANPLTTKSDTSIWVSNIDGSNQHPVLDTSANDINPRFSPDGQRVMAISSPGTCSGLGCQNSPDTVYVAWASGLGQSALFGLDQASSTHYGTPNFDWSRFTNKIIVAVDDGYFHTRDTPGGIVVVNQVAAAWTDYGTFCAGHASCYRGEKILAVDPDTGATSLLNWTRTVDDADWTANCKYPAGTSGTLGARCRIDGRLRAVSASKITMLNYSWHGSGVFVLAAIDTASPYAWTDDFWSDGSRSNNQSVSPGDSGTAVVRTTGNGTTFEERELGGTVLGAPAAFGEWEAVPYFPPAVQVPVGQTYGAAEIAARPTGSVSDPVDSGTGAFRTEVMDLSLPGLALPFQWTRSYTSLDGTSGQLGAGWTHSYAWSLTTTSNTVTVRTGSGQQVVYTGPSSTGPFTAPAGASGGLTKIPTGWKLTTSDALAYEFNASGQLVKISDENGRQATLAYTSGKLSSITDTVGRVITVTTSSGRVTAVTLPDGRSVSYTYDANNRLATVTDARGKVWTYAYDGSSTRLASVFDPRGNYPYRNTYNATSGRVSSQLDPLGNQTSFAWASSGGAGVATTTDPAGKMWKDYYWKGQLQMRVNPLGQATQYQYDPARFLLRKVIDPRGKTTTFTYDDAGRIKTKTDALGNIEHWFYDSNGRLTHYTNQRGRTTKYGYDANGNLTVRAEPGNVTRGYGYDGLGRLTSYTDPRGKVTAYTYDSLDLLTQVEAPLGGKTTFNYDTKGRIASTVEPRGNVSGCGCAPDYTTSYTYDNQDRVLSVTDALSNTTSKTYDAVGNLATVTNALNKTWTYAYNAANEQTSVTDPASVAATTEYDSRGNVSALVDQVGARTTFTYDDANRLKTTVLPKGNAPGGTPADYTITLTRDANGNVIGKVDQLGQSSSTTYDALNRPLTTTNERGKTSSVGYDENGNVLTVTDERGKTTTFTHDDRDRVATRTDPRSKTRSFTYTTADQLLSETDPLGNVASRTYDDNGRLLTTVEPRGNVSGCGCAGQYTTSYGYDPAGHLLTITDPLGKPSAAYTYDRVGRTLTARDALNRQTGWTYDPLGRIASVSDPLSKMTSYGYDDLGRLTSVTDALNHATGYHYDDVGRLTRREDAAGNAWTYSYDLHGNLVSSTDANGNATVTPTTDGVTSRAYDRLDRPTGIDYSDATPDVSIQYNPVGSISQITDGAGTKTYAYNDAEQVSSITRGSDTFAYSYDDAGNLATRTLPDNTVFTYGYDDAGRTTSASWNSKTITQGYDPAGNLTSRTLPASNGYVEQRTYDRAGRLSRLQNVTGTSTLSDYQISRDDSGLPTRIDKVGGAIETFQYDGAARLSEVCYQAACPAGSDPFIRWTYDDVGNRTSETRAAGSTTYTLNNLNQVTAESGLVNNTYSYDADGQRLSKGSTSYTYDLAGRTTSVTRGGTTTSYSYDALGNRLSATTGSNDTTYLWDETPANDQVALERDGTGTLLRRYTDAGFETASGSFYSHLDPFQNVTAITNATGATQWRYEYEPFGTTRVTNQDDPAAPTNVKGWAGELTDPTSALVNLRARQYDPANATFTSQDPLSPPAGTPLIGAYTYVNQMPTTMLDPSGMWGISLGDAWDVTKGVAGAVAAIVGEAVLAVTHPVETYNAIAGSVRDWNQMCGVACVIGGFVDTLIVQPLSVCLNGAGNIEATTRACTKAVATLIPTGYALIKGAATVSRAARATALARWAAEEEAALVNGAGRAYPRVLDPRTSEPIPAPGSGLAKVPVGDRAPWGAQERGAFIKEWYDRGYSTPEGGWAKYDIHHITPREYGGTNDFNNLAPVLRGTHQQEFNAWWRDYP
jgi:RHS repeat-associated protein